MAWIRNVPPGEAVGRLRASYERAVARAGKVYQIVSAMSLSPATLDASMGLYLAVMYGPSGLSRKQRELLAVVVSAENDCHY